MRILFYIPFTHRSRDTESLMLAFKEQGHDVISLNQIKDSLIHKFLAEKGIETHEYPIERKSNLIFYLRHTIHFIWFCWKHKIDVVYSHLEPTSFVAVIGQFFVPARIYVCRHHEDLFALSDRDKYLTYRLTYGLARKIIVVSDSTKKYLIKHENIPVERIVEIKLGYDFSLYELPDETKIQKLRAELKADLVLITIGQLMPLKRPDISIRILDSLVKQGINAKLILLGQGSERPDLVQLTESLGLSAQVIFQGHVTNVLDFIACSTFLIHPSVSESSCVVVKEAALLQIPVIVSQGVGDFDSFIRNGLTGFSVPREKFVEESISIINEYIQKPVLLQQIGKNLDREVHRLFSIANTIKEYEQLNNFK